MPPRPTCAVSHPRCRSASFSSNIIAPAYYMSMGFSVAASIGVALTNPNYRPYVLVGDGAFQMTGTELSTAVRLELNPIILMPQTSARLVTTPAA